MGSVKVVLKSYKGLKYDFDASTYAPGTILYVRVYVQDTNHPEPIETPKEGSAKQIIYLFTLYVN